MSKENQSWREQRKTVVCTDTDGHRTEYISVWQAALAIASTMLCKHETAKKEIRKAIRTGCSRYGMKWEFAS